MVSWNWIWIVVAVVFLYLMMRRGGCGGMAHGSDGEHAHEQAQPEAVEPDGADGPGTEGEHRRRRGGCC